MQEEIICSECGSSDIKEKHEKQLWDLGVVHLARIIRQKKIILFLNA